MTAKEANKLADDSFNGSYFDSTMDEIYSKIKDQCLKGNKYVYIEIKDYRLGIRIWQKLCDDGYEVTKILSDHTDWSKREIKALSIYWFDHN
jgi:ppGpp synthetase/RelA/SpoT-type nucleotidyltranferase